MHMDALYRAMFYLEDDVCGTLKSEPTEGTPPLNEPRGAAKRAMYLNCLLKQAKRSVLDIGDEHDWRQVSNHVC